VNDVRWKCVCAYDGGPFAGWQSQAGGNAVQDVIETRLATLFQRQIRIHGSGRTDAGVHALGQVFHFDADWRHGPTKLMIAMRVGLPASIQIKSVRRVSKDFHARFTAIGKQYEYRIHIGDATPFVRPYCWTVYRALSLELMENAARELRGTHDFRAFTVLNGPAREDTTRELRRLSLSRRGKVIRIVAEADGFLYKMVRSLVGVLVAAGENRLPADRISKLLTERKRTAEVQTAPAQGLFLMKVFYPASLCGKDTGRRAVEIVSTATPGQRGDEE
jgi:tRNA pseudouridine38-40 synthase